VKSSQQKNKFDGSLVKHRREKKRVRQRPLGWEPEETSSVFAMEWNLLLVQEALALLPERAERGSLLSERRDLCLLYREVFKDPPGSPQ
jgi:hypothetical protein